MINKSMPNNTMQAFARNMRTLMSNRGVSFRKLGRGTGIPIGSLHAYAQGKTAIPLSRAKDIALFFGLTVDDIAREGDQAI